MGLTPELIELLEYQQRLRALKEKRYLKGVSKDELEYITKLMNENSTEIRGLKWASLST